MKVAYKEPVSEGHNNFKANKGLYIMNNVHGCSVLRVPAALGIFQGFRCAWGSVLKEAVERAGFVTLSL